MTNTEIRLNPIEERLLEHWEYLIESNEEETFFETDADRIHVEVELFLEEILPIDYPLCDWAFWSDGTEFLTKSEELADRLAKIIDFFADAHTGCYDPEEDERNGETNGHTGYWYVTWD